MSRIFIDSFDAFENGIENITDPNISITRGLYMARYFYWISSPENTKNGPSMFVWKCAGGKGMMVTYSKMIRNSASLLPRIPALTSDDHLKIDFVDFLNASNKAIRELCVKEVLFKLTTKE